VAAEFKVQFTLESSLRTRKYSAQSSKKSSPIRVNAWMAQS
jgi:hypothetical protein